MTRPQALSFRCSVSVLVSACLAGSLGSSTTLFAQTLEFHQHIEIGPGQSIEATVTARLNNITVTCSQRELVCGAMKGSRLMLTAKRPGTADVIVTGSGLTDIVEGPRAETPTEESAATPTGTGYGYRVREILAVRVATGVRASASPAAAPVVAPGAILSLRHKVDLASGQEARLKLRGVLSPTVRTSNTALVTAQVMPAELTLTAVGQTGSAQVTLTGRIGRSFLDFGLLPTEELGEETSSAGYPFKELITVNLIAVSSASTHPPSDQPKATDDSAGRGMPARPGGPGKGNPGDKKNQPEDAKGANAEPKPLVVSQDLSLRVGDKSHADVPAHAKVFSANSTSPEYARVGSKDDQVTICGSKPGRSDIKIAGEVLQLEAGGGASGRDYPFEKVVHVQVTGPDPGLTGRWSSNKPEHLHPQGSGDTVTIVQNGNNVTLKDGHQMVWDGSISGNNLQLSHTYGARDVGQMESRWPKWVQEQLVGITRRISGTLNVADDCSISLSAQYDLLNVVYDPDKKTVKSTNKVTQEIKLWRQTTVVPH